MGLSLEGFRSVVRELRDVTGLVTGRELGEWWRIECRGWLEFVERESGGFASLARDRDRNAKS